MSYKRGQRSQMWPTTNPEVPRCPVEYRTTALGLLALSGNNQERRWKRHGLCHLKTMSLSQVMRLSMWDLYLAGWSEQAVCQLARPAKRQQDKSRGPSSAFFVQSQVTQRDVRFCCRKCKNMSGSGFPAGEYCWKKKKQSREMSGIDFARLQRTI